MTAHASDLDDLAAFAAVGRTRNFRRAAAQLRMSASGLSQRIRDLEARLGVRLLHRTTRSVAPTEAGERLLRRLAPALQAVADATVEVRSLSDRPSGRLRINGPEPALRHVLAPLVGPFLLRYPGIELDIVSESSLVDIVREGFDAGIRYEETLAQDMIAVSLGPPERALLVAAPDVVARLGLLEHPKALVGRPCLGTRFRSGVVLPWEFRKGRGSVRITPQGPLMALSIDVLVAAACDGAGYLLTHEGNVRGALAAGRLVSLLEDWRPYEPGPFLYYPGRRQLPPALAAFVAFVRERNEARMARAPRRRA